MDVESDLQAAALAYVTHGFALTWLDYGAKAPKHPGWNTPEKVVTTADQARKVWNGTARNIGLVHGLGKLKTCSLDADRVPDARATLAEFGIDLDDLRQGPPAIEGKPGNFRLLFRQPEGVGLKAVKLEWPDPDHPEAKVTVFELRAGANQDVLPPSKHPSGKLYRWLTPLPASPEDIPEPPAALLELWQNWEAWLPELHAACPWAKPAEPKATPRPKEARPHAGIIGRFNEAHDVRAILEAHGYKPKGTRRFLPPRSTSGVPSVRVLDSGKVFSSNGSCPLNDNHAHDAFSAFCILAHRGDVKAAVQDAARQLDSEWKSDPRRQQPGTPPPADADYLDALGSRKPPQPDKPDWPEPFPLPIDLPAVDPFPPEILPERLRPWIADISERLQCPPDYPAVGAMMSIAAVVGRKIGLCPKRHDDWLVVPNLWGVINGRPGVLKSPALQEAMRPLWRLEMEAKNQHALETKDAEANKAVAEARRKVGEAKLREAIKKDRGDPYEIARLSAHEDATAPIRRRYIVNDSSVEKLGEMLNENPNGLLVFRDELLGLLYALDRDGQEGARQFYLESWNGNGRFTYDRIGRGTVDIEACCLSILGSIQPGPLQAYLATAPDDGLMQRFQLAVWPDMEPAWRDVDRWPDKAAKERATEVFSRLNTLTPLALGAAPASEGGIPYLRFAPDAQAEFSRWRAKLENRLRAEELHPALETALAKYRSLIPALALLIHLVDVAEGGPVGLPALLKACAWGEYLESHAKRIYSAQIAPAILSASRLALKIKSGALKERFTLRDIYRPAWSGLTTTDQAQAAARVLTDHDWLRSETEQTQGRPRTYYVVNPRIKEVRP